MNNYTMILTTLVTLAENTEKSEREILQTALNFIEKNYKGAFKKQAKQNSLRLDEVITGCFTAALWTFIVEDDEVCNRFLTTKLYKCKGLIMYDVLILALLQQIVSHPILSDKTLEDKCCISLQIMAETMAITNTYAATNTANIVSKTYIDISEALLKWIRMNETVYNKLKQIATEEDI